MSRLWHTNWQTWESRAVFCLSRIRNTKNIIPSIPIIPKLYGPVFDCEGDTYKTSVPEETVKTDENWKHYFFWSYGHIPSQNFWHYFKYETAPVRHLHRRCFLRITTRPDTGDGAVYISAIAIHSLWLFLYMYIAICETINWKWNKIAQLQFTPCYRLCPCSLQCVKPYKKWTVVIYNWW